MSHFEWVFAAPSLPFSAQISTLEVHILSHNSDNFFVISQVAPQKQ